MTTAEQYWLYQQLEPGDILPPARPFKSNWRPIAPVVPTTQDQRDWLAYRAMSEDEQNRIEDERLAELGVDVNPKQRI